MKFYGINSRGKFWVHRVADVANEVHRGPVDEGRLLYNLADKHIYAGSESKWIKITVPYDTFDSGTKIIFNSYPLPPNWTIDSTYNDRMIVLTSNTSEVFTSSGTWTISGLQASGQHAHGGRTGGPTRNSSYIGASDLYGWGSTTGHVHSITADGQHQHSFDGSWRPKFIASIVATYS